MNTSTATEVRTYLDRLRAELAGLPAGEIEEILQDVEPQVTAVAAELGADTALADRLGDPAAYARELRGALGMPDEPPASHPRLWQARTGLAVLALTTLTAVVAGHVTSRISSNDPRSFLVALAVGLAATWLAVGRDRSVAAEIAALPEVRFAAAKLAEVERTLPVGAYLTSVRPGLRLVKAALVWLGATWLLAWCGWTNAGAATLAAVTAVVTVLAGYRAQRDRRWLWLTVPLTGWAVGVALKAAQVLPGLSTGHYV